MEQTGAADENKFKSALEQISDKFGNSYDFIFFDAQAGSDIYAEISISIANEVIIVSEYDPVSFAGIDRLTTIFAKIMPYEKRWVLYNKVLPDFAKEMGKTRLAERILPPIPWDEEVVRAFAERKLALNTEKGSEHTLAIMRTVASLLGEEIRKEIENWKSQKSDLIRKPITTQSQQTGKEIIAFRRALIENEYKLNRLKRQATTLVIYGLFALMISLTYVGLFAYQYFHASLYEMTTLLTTVAAVVIALVYLIIQSRMIATRRKEIELTEQVTVLRDKLNSLIETNKKLKTLMDSDMEQLLEK